MYNKPGVLLNAGLFVVTVFNNFETELIHGNLICFVMKS